VHWSFSYTPAIWPSILAVLLMLGLAVFSSRRSNIPCAIPLMIGSLFGAAWAFGSVMEYTATDLAVKILWVKFQTIFQLPAVTAVTCFVLEYAWPGRWLSKRNLVILSLAPLMVFGMVLFDSRLHWIWSGFEWNNTVSPQLAPGGWAAIMYSFMLGVLNLIALTWLFLHSPQHRWVVVVILIGQVGVRTLYVLEKGNYAQSRLPLDVIGLTFIVMMYSIALYGFRIFDPIPLAQRTLIGQLRDGVLVLDPQGRVASSNAAFERMIDIVLKQVKGKPVTEILPGFKDLGTPLEELAAQQAPVELTLGAGAEQRSCELETLPLYDFRGLAVGYLLLLHDVSDQRRSQAQILEQQRTLAMLKEREHLARELHDELAQGLASINVHAQLVSGLLEAGQPEEAQAQLQILAQAARNAQVDVRGEIRMLSYRMDPVEGFLESLRRYLHAFQETHKIQTELAASTDFPMRLFSPTVETQLMHIVQEAFTNIQKHAMAKHVRVYAAREHGSFKLKIEDDGRGFDLEQIRPANNSFGQGIMAQRAAEVGGRVEINSAPGKGTRVLIEVPMDGGGE